MDLQRAIFMDTSIIIGQLFHSPAMRDRIEFQLARHKSRVTSSVVRQEFRRRVIKEARYLLGLLENTESFESTMRHVHDRLPPASDRKRRICMQILMTIQEDQTDSDKLDRAKSQMRMLLHHGLRQFNALADKVIDGASCACSQQPVARPKRGEYDLGTEKCSETSGCGLDACLGVQSQEAVVAVHEHLIQLPAPDKTSEIQRGEDFLNDTNRGRNNPARHDPCLKVGDLLIAIESKDVPTFYTMNWKESRHYCMALRQTLIVRRQNPELADEIYPAGETWNFDAKGMSHRTPKKKAPQKIIKLTGRKPVE